MHRNVNRRGQAIVELAVVFPCFLLIIVGGMIDFGLAFNNLLTLQQIVHDACSHGAADFTNPSWSTTDGLPTPEIQQYIHAQKPAWWTGRFTINAVTTGTAPSGGRVKTIVLSYESPAYTPFYRALLNTLSKKEAISLSVSATFPIPQCLGGSR